MRQLTLMLVPVVALLFSAPAAAQAVCNTGYGFVIKDVQHRDAFMAKLAEAGIPVEAGSTAQLCVAADQREVAQAHLQELEPEGVSSVHFAIGDSEVARRLEAALENRGIPHLIEIADSERVFAIHPAQEEAVHKIAAEISAAVQSEVAGR